MLPRQGDITPTNSVFKLPNHFGVDRLETPSKTSNTHKGGAEQPLSPNSLRSHPHDREGIEQEGLQGLACPREGVHHVVSKRG
eukprot:283160-Amphidinium_carterae.1